MKTWVNETQSTSYQNTKVTALTTITYYDDEDKLWVGRIYHSADGEFTNMVAWRDENEDLMEPLFYSMVDEYITFKKQMEYKYGKPVNKK